MSSNLTHRPSFLDGNLAHRPSHRDGNLSHRPSHAGVKYLRRSKEEWKESSFASFSWLPPPNMSGETNCGEKKKHHEENKPDDNNNNET